MSLSPRLSPLSRPCLGGCQWLLAMVACLCGLSMISSPAAAPKATAAAASNDAEDVPEVLEPLELRQLIFHRELLQSCLDPLKAHLSDLARLTTQLAASRRYEDALRIQKEQHDRELDLERISREILLLESREKSLRTALLPGRIILPLEKALLNGPRYDEKKKEITDWSRAGDSVEWKLPDLPSGGYEVILHYECSAVEGGRLEVAEESYHLSGLMDTTLRGPEAKNLGTLKITRGDGPLRLTASTVVKRNLMHLRGVELIPANR